MKVVPVPPDYLRCKYFQFYRSHITLKSHILSFVADSISVRTALVNASVSFNCSLCIECDRIHCALKDWVKSSPSATNFYQPIKDTCFYYDQLTAFMQSVVMFDLKLDDICTRRKTSSGILFLYLTHNSIGIDGDNLDKMNLNNLQILCEVLSKCEWFLRNHSFQHVKLAQVPINGYINIDIYKT